MQHTNLERRHSHQFDQGNPLAQKKILIATIFNRCDDDLRNLRWMDF